MSETVRIWMENIGKHPSVETIMSEIEEAKSAIENERLWALGSNSQEVAEMHNENVSLLEEYIESLNELLAQ